MSVFSFVTSVERLFTLRLGNSLKQLDFMNDPTSLASEQFQSATHSNFNTESQAHFIGEGTYFPLHRSSSYFLRSSTTLADQEILNQLQSITLALNSLVKSQQANKDDIRQLQQRFDQVNLGSHPGPSSIPIPSYPQVSCPPSLSVRDFTDQDIPKLKEVVDSWRDKRSKKEGEVFLNLLEHADDPDQVRNIVSQQFRLLAKADVLGWAQTTAASNPSLQILHLSTEEDAAVLQSHATKPLRQDLGSVAPVSGMVPPSRANISATNFSRPNYNTTGIQPPRFDGAGRPIRDPAAYMAAVQRNRAKSRESRR
jgi:hypothetical protein